MRILVLIICLLMTGHSAIAQQWSGNNNQTDPITRTGTVTTGNFITTGTITATGAIGSSSTSNLVLRTGVTDRMSFLLNGNVGIGVASPVAQFQVGAGRPVLIKSNGGQGVYGSELGFNAILDTYVVPNQIKKLGGTSQNGGANISVDYHGNMRFQMLTGGAETEYITNYAPQISFLNSGNVGIGTTTPGYPLEISTTQTSLSITSSANHPLSIVNRSQVANSIAGIQFKDADGLTPGAGVIGMRFTSPGTDYAGFFVGTRGADGFLERLTITDAGLVGFGTTTPASKLDVVAGGQSLRLLTGTNTSSYRLDIGVNDNGINFSSNSAIRGYNFSNQAGTLMTIKSDGKVGIGTTAPGSYKLAVEGKIGAREVNVTTAAWSDYVFDKDYKLPSLAEVRAYIDRHHHLPDVPSEQEVLQNGQNLGEMNAVLLKKVEELTLYLLEHQQMIGRLTESNRELVNEVNALKSKASSK